MKPASNVVRLLLVSPWFLAVFLIIPLCVVLTLALHLPIPLLGTPRALFYNNILFDLLVAARLVRYVAVLRRSIRYGAAAGGAGKFRGPVRSVESASVSLRRDGYHFDESLRYAEKRDLGYPGVCLLYGGFFILLSAGIWNNLQQFSGVILDSIGPATDLSRRESYRSLRRGPLSTGIDALPKMEILNQHFPGEIYPRGATEISLIGKDGKVRKEALVPTDPVRYGDFDIYMTKLVYEPELVIRDSANRVLFDDLVRLDPLVQKRGPFSFYGAYIGSTLVGGVYYQPEESLLKVVITRDGKREVVDMTFQVNQQVQNADYILSCAKMGQWSEIHVVRHRNMTLLVAGGVLALIGLLLRLLYPPRRVWLKEAEGGCEFSTTDKDVEKLLRDE